MTPSISATFTVSPTAGAVTVVLRVYDSASVLIYEVAAGTSSGAVLDFSLDKATWDPSLGPLTLSSPPWSFAYSGASNFGALQNGVYRLDVVSSGGATGLVSKTVLVLRSNGPGVGGLAWPNPAGAKTQIVFFAWSPTNLDVEAWVYNNAGEKVSALGILSGGRGAWVLGSAANGIYLIALRAPNERRPRLIKVALAR